MVNVDMTPEQRLAELRWSHIVLLTLQQESSGFPKLNKKVLRMELLIVLLKPLGYLIPISLSYPRSWFNLQTRFIFCNHYAVNIKIKVCSKNSFHWILILLIEYKYILLNANVFLYISFIFNWIQIFFHWIEIYFSNTNIFS